MSDQNDNFCQTKNPHSFEHFFSFHLFSLEYGSLLIMRQVYYAIVNGQEIAENQEQLLHVNTFQLNKLIVELLQ